MLPSGGTGGYQQDDAAKSTTEQTRSSYHHDLSTQYHQQQRLLNDEPIPTFMTAAAQDDGSSMHHHHQYLIDTATQQQQQQQQPFYHYYLGDNDDDGTITGSSVPMFLQGRHDQEHYDPTLTPLPGPSRTSTSLSVSDQQHIWQQQVAAIEQAAAIEQQQQQQQQAAIAAQAAAAVALDDFEYVKEQQQQQQQCQEQALFGRLVSMARAPGSSNSSCIATQQDDTWSSPNLHSLHYGSAWATTPATTPTAMMEEQNEPLHSIQETIMSSDQLQNAQFELKVVQQPSRARMCGFGDKDRRPISPPPIVQLIVRASDGTQIPAR